MVFMNLKYIYLFLLFLLFNGCVSSSQYFRQVEENKLLSAEIRALKYLNEQNEKLKNTVSEQNEKLYLCENKLSDTEQKMKSLYQQNQNLQLDQEKMNERNKALLEKAFEDKKILTEELIAKQVLLNEKDKTIRRLEQRIAVLRNDTDAPSDLLPEGTSVRKDADSDSILLVATRDQLIKNLGLLAPGEFLVEQKPGGTLAVMLFESLLFEPKSARLTEKGKNTLLSLIRLLNTRNIKDVCVEHMMDQEVTGETESDLSAGRLVTVYQAFRESGINTKQLVLPVQKNKDQAAITPIHQPGATQKIRIEFKPDQVKD